MLMSATQALHKIITFTSLQQIFINISKRGPINWPKSVNRLPESIKFSMINLNNFNQPWKIIYVFIPSTLLTNTLM